MICVYFLTKKEANIRSKKGNNKQKKRERYEKEWKIKKVLH